jgi:hypothetical protein
MRRFLVIALFCCITLFGCVVITAANTVVRQVQYVPCRSSCGVYYPAVVPYTPPTVVPATLHRR